MLDVVYTGLQRTLFIWIITHRLKTIFTLRSEHNILDSPLCSSQPGCQRRRAWRPAGCGAVPRCPCFCRLPGFCRSQRAPGCAACCSAGCRGGWARPAQPPARCSRPAAPSPPASCWTHSSNGICRVQRACGRPCVSQRSGCTTLFFICDFWRPTVRKNQGRCRCWPHDAVKRARADNF